jgi:hypothetical protein
MLKQKCLLVGYLSYHHTVALGITLGQLQNSPKMTKAKTTGNARRTALIACLAALCIGTNYAMLPLPNVKLMDAVVFTTGLFFGMVPGVSVAVISWLVYGTLNPLGITLPVLLAVILCETIYAVVGYFLQRVTGNSENNITGLEQSIVFGTAGLFSTLAYDLITNAVSGLIAYNSVWMGILTMNVPLPLGIMHEASNFVFFATITPLLVRLLRKGALPMEISFRSSKN